MNSHHFIDKNDANSLSFACNLVYGPFFPLKTNKFFYKFEKESWNLFIFVFGSITT